MPSNILVLSIEDLHGIRSAYLQQDVLVGGTYLGCGEDRLMMAALRSLMISYVKRLKLND
jgi:hypothetical protein